MNLKLLSPTSAVGVILMDKAVGPLIRGVQQLVSPVKNATATGPFFLRKPVKKLNM